MLALPYSMPLTLQQATADSHLLDTHRQVWVNLLRGHCSFLLGPGVHKVLFVTSKSLFPQSCVSSGGFMVRLMMTSSKEGLCHTQVCCTQSPLPLRLTHTSTGDAKTLKGRSDSISVGSPGEYNVLFEPSKHLWWEWGLILNAVLPLLLSCWGFSFGLGHGVFCFGGIRHSPVHGCSALSCNFGILIGEDKCMSFYSTILI